MSMRFSGLEISDDAIRCIQYVPGAHGLVLGKYDSVDLPPDTVVGGDIKNEAVLLEKLGAFCKKNALTYVSVAVPEEKAYLFETDVTGKHIKEIAQNIEFKMEENVPLAAKDAVFYFDLMPLESTGGVLRASVSVVPSSYIEKQISMLESVGLEPVAFEVVPKSIARAAMKKEEKKASFIVHVMRSKVGIYISCGGVVCFTSTFSVVHTSDEKAQEDLSNTIVKGLNQAVSYWSTKASVQTIDEVVITGERGIQFKEIIAQSIESLRCPINVGNVWQNVFDVDTYLPPISKEESLPYVVAAGLALNE